MSRRRRHNWLVRRRMSLARQLLLLQLVVVTVAVVVAGVVAVRAADDRATEQQRERVLSLAETLSASGEVRAALRRDDPSAVLQPLAERVRRRVGPRVRRVHEPVRRALLAPQSGQDRRPVRRDDRSRPRRTPVHRDHDRHARPLGPRGRADPRRLARVRPRRGRRPAGRDLRSGAPASCRAWSRSLAIAVLVGRAALDARRAARPAPDARPGPARSSRPSTTTTTRCCTRSARASWSSGATTACASPTREARRLLALARGRASGARSPTSSQDASLVEALRGRRRPRRACTSSAAGCSSPGQRPAERDGKRLATVTTLRDRTELEGLVRELATVRGIADALRAQAHESANELHTVVGLVELGRYDDAIAFATPPDRRRRRTRSTSSSSASAIRRSPRCCSPRGRRAASAASTSSLDARQRAARRRAAVRGPRDHRRQPRRQRARRARRPASAAGSTCGSSARRERVRIQVRDDGPGISDDALGHVFEAGLVHQARRRRRPSRARARPGPHHGRAPRRRRARRPTTAARCSPSTCPHAPRDAVGAR